MLGWRLPAGVAARLPNLKWVCSVAAGVYVFGLVLIAFAPETKGKPLPE